MLLVCLAEFPFAKQAQHICISEGGDYRKHRDNLTPGVFTTSFSILRRQLNTVWSTILQSEFEFSMT